MFRLTEAAAEQVRKAAAQSGAEGMALRLAARQLPDGTFEYKMGFDEKKEDDIDIQSEGITVIMMPEYVPILNETVMDFVQLDEGDHQFVFQNPKDANYQPPSA